MTTPSFFAAPADFLLLTCALLQFFLVASLVSGLRMDDARSVRLYWSAGAGTYGAALVWSLLQPHYANFVAAEWVSQGLFAVSSLLLAEAGRRSWQAYGQAILPWWLTPVAVVVGVGGGLAVGNLAAGTALALCLPGGILLARGFRDLAPGLKRLPAWVVTLVFVQLPITRAATQIATLAGDQFQPWVLPWVLGSHAVAILGAAGLLWEFAVAHEVRPQGFGLLRFDRLLLLASLMVLTGGFLLTQHVASTTDGQMRNGWLSVARSSAAVVNAGKLLAEPLDESAIETPAYRDLHYHLSLLRSAAVDARYIYLLTLQGDQVVFLVDAEDLDSEDHSPPGQIYEEATPELLRALRERKPLVEGPSTDRWGTWVSALAPTAGLQDSAHPVLLGIDIEASDWAGRVALARIQPMLITHLVALVFIVFMVVMNQTVMARVAVERSSEELRSVFDTVEAGIIVHRLDGTIVEANTRFVQLLGLEDRSFDRDLAFEIAGVVRTASATPACWSAAAAGTPQSFERELRHRRSRDLVQVAVTLMRHQRFGETVLIATLQDIGCLKETERALHSHAEARLAQLEEINDKNHELEAQAATLESLTVQLEALARRDVVTSLFNRRGFETYLSEQIAQVAATGAELHIAFLDLDNFKLVNDSLGHPAGDQLLRGVASRLTQVIPEATAARFGGDEFTLLFVGLSSAEVAQALGRLTEAIRKPFSIWGHDVVVGASIGYAKQEDGITDMREVLRHADTALYNAKARGKDRWVAYEAWMGEAVAQRRQLESELRQALDEGQFRVFFQPIVDLSTMQLHGAEALVRWQHPTEGLLPPSHFLETAKDCGLMPALGGWVLEHSIQTAKHWPTRHDRPLNLFVNLSGSQFELADLAQFTERALGSAQFDPHRLVLEVSEEAVLRDMQSAITRLGELREIGVLAALDDFGSGMSSMGRLTTLPIDLVKTDRSLFNGIQDDVRIMAVFRAVSALCHAIEVGLVAEGLEDDEAVAIGISLGCTYGQGYHFGRPMPNDDFVRLANGWVPPRARRIA